MQSILLAAAVTTAVRQKTVSCAMNTIRHYSSVTCTSTSTTKLNMKSIPEAAVESVLVAPLDAKQKEYEGLNVCQAMKHLANADAVCFDVDSTVIQEEGIDVLAASLGKFEEVSAWTAKAMNGGVKFEDALAARLQILQPSRQDIDACLTHHPFQLTPGIQELVRTLQERSIHVYLVSGGFRQMIEPVAARLDIPLDRIYANRILFDESNNYQYHGFDTAEPTSADQGKPKALHLIKQKGNYNTMVMVGDGATDAQAKPPADSFIGFGGVVEREAVRTRACWFVRDFQDMIAAVKEWKGKEC